MADNKDKEEKKDTAPRDMSAVERMQAELNLQKQQEPSYGNKK